MRKTKHLSLILLLVAVVACNETTTTPVPDNEDPPVMEDPTPTKLDLISQLWSIDTAYHQGNYDASSTGKKIQFLKTGRYIFDNDLQGDWYFTPDSSQIIIDEGLSYEQEWNIEDLSENRFEVTFRSPFTNGASHWIMYAE